MMDEKRIAELQRLCAEATKLPWCMEGLRSLLLSGGHFRSSGRAGRR